MSSTDSINSTSSFSVPGRTGAKPTPQLPMTTVVTPCQHDGVTSLSQHTWPSKCVWMSTKPGVTRRPSASIVRRARRPTAPTSVMMPSHTDTSPMNAGAPVPSTMRPFLMTRSSTEPSWRDGLRLVLRLEDDLGGAERLELLRGEAEQPLQDLVGVDTGQWGGVLDGARRSRHRPRDPGMDAPADGRVLELHEVAPLAEVRVLGEVAVAHGRERGDAGLLQGLGRVPAVPRARPCRDDLVERGLVLLAQFGAREPRIGGQRRLADRVAQRLHSSSVPTAIEIHLSSSPSDL